MRMVKEDLCHYCGNKFFCKRICHLILRPLCSICNEVFDAGYSGGYHDGYNKGNSDIKNIIQQESNKK